MSLPRFHLAVLGPLLLTACAMLPRPADPQIVSLARTVSAQAGSFFAGLASKQAADCGFDANSDAYKSLAELAAALNQHIAAHQGSAALVQASAALERTLADARASHAAASAKTDDANGACMAAGAIALNAEAIARAIAAIAATQNAAGG